ncbi:MAG TPA: F0F1 ATP synthase subunit delta [Rugosimonospora sp.]|nr:F0F1 ATP synthase subunit delta [Rugosimonospora sp.]
MQPDRESYRPAAQRLAAQFAEASPDTLVSASDELLAVGRLLGREPRLRRALADPARPAEQRVELLRSILSGKVDGEVVELATALVGARWASAADLLDAVERLGVDALLAAADKGGELPEVEDELFRFGQVVDGSPELAATLGDPIAPVEQRASLTDDLLGSRARPVTVRLVRVALAGFGGRGFSSSLGRLVELAAARREEQVAYVVAAAPLSEQDEARLGARLAEMYGRGVSLKITVDPKIIGGLSVQVGSDLYDGTVVRRLAEIRSALTK